MPYSNILVGLDDSKYSEAALIEAAHWARRHGGRVSVVNTVFFDSEEFSISPRQLDERIDRGKDLCSSAARECSSKFGVEIECIVRHGEPHEVIPEVAREGGFDLIALGTYGRKGLKRLVMGSVTAGVILNAPCDVLVVKKACKACNGVYSSLLVPYDGSDLGKKAIERAAALGKADPGVSMTLTYVIPRYEEMIGFLKTEGIRERLSEEAERVIIQGRTFVGNNGVPVEAVIEEGSPSKRIVEIAKERGSDLIVMGSHGWHGMDRALVGSTTERVIAHSEIPVLVTR